MRTVFLLIRIASAASISESFIRITSADSIAISTPLPIAIPTSALTSATASFIPSPTISTEPVSEYFLTAASFPLGITSAITSSIPTDAAIAFAVCKLSPVSITLFTPSVPNSPTASALSALTLSDTAIIPISVPFFVK